MNGPARRESIEAIPFRPLGDRASRIGRTEAAALKALGDPTARRLLVVLSRQEMEVQALVMVTGAPVSSTYRKLQDLEADGLIRVVRFAFSPEGRKVEVFGARIRELRVRLAKGVLRVDVSTLEDSADRIGAMWDQVARRDR